MTETGPDPAIPTGNDPTFLLELTSGMYGTHEFLYYSLDAMLAGAKDLFGRASREWEDDRQTRRICLVIGKQDEQPQYRKTGEQANASKTERTETGPSGSKARWPKTVEEENAR